MMLVANQARRLRAPYLYNVLSRFAVWSIVALLLTSCAIPVTVSQNQNTGWPAPNQQQQAAPNDAASAVGCERTPGACVTERLLTSIVDYLTFFAELCGAFVIAVGIVRGLLRFLPNVVRLTRVDETYQEDIRLQLGKSLALALEFELGADILKTAVAPSFAVIAQLAAIIVLRTALNYFLERELRQSEQRRAGQHLEPAKSE